MKKGNIKSLLFAVFCGFYAFCATAAVSLFSDYGQIQNIQNYSTNPFWTPNSPYNQRMPQPVYVQGADLNAEDCFNVVQSLVSVQCMARDNCKDTSLADIRPTIMVQLSNLPGNNYVSACSGYIDGVFESYVARYGNSVPNRAVAFPTATTPNPDLNNDNKIQIQNPYKQVTPKWQQEIKERSDELQQLQKQNGAGSEHLSATAFPKTFEDLSFKSRMELKTEGYAPYKDFVAYETLNVLTEKEWCEGKGRDSKDCEEYEKRKNETKEPVPEIEVEDKPDINDTNAFIKAAVAFLKPQNKAEKEFFTDLVTDFVDKRLKEGDKSERILNEEFVYDFLAEHDDNQLTKYKEALTTVTGTAESDAFFIHLDWDQILIELSTLRDITFTRYGVLVCENNRSYQALIDVAMWAPTIVSLGTGAVVSAAAKATLGAGLKALAKGAAKVGIKKATVNGLSQAGRKQIIAAATKVGVRGTMRTMATTGSKALLKETAKRAAKKPFENLLRKRTMLLAAGATVYETIGKPGISSRNIENHSKANTLYSLVESGSSKNVINCQDVDWNEGCYTVCGSGTPDDDLNVKIFKPLFGRTYCVNQYDYALYDMETNKPFMLTKEGYEKVIKKAKQDVADKGQSSGGIGNWFKVAFNINGNWHGCDYNEDDIDMYFGSYVYDPDKSEPSALMTIEEVVRIDD